MRTGAGNDADPPEPLEEPTMSKKKPRPATRFGIGDKVRVRRGVMDSDYPDMPIGGWAGTVLEVQDDGTCVVRWSGETQASIHPVFRNRCENDGLTFEEYCIDAGDLEPDAGGSLDIEQPVRITTRPLSPADEDDRVRMVFGLTSNDTLPDVDEQTLRAYRQYLSNKLAFPFTATYDGGYGRAERVEVIGLGDPDEPMIDEMEGILCEARVKGRLAALPLGELGDARGKQNRRLIEDYCYWLHNFA
jgi:hypothetical protein